MNGPLAWGRPSSTARFIPALTCGMRVSRQGITRGHSSRCSTEEELPVRHHVRDPQVDLVRRYARILRSAPAEALRLQKNRTLATAARARAPLAMTDQAPAATASPPRASARPQ
jgi:hypothetical protein